MKSIILAAVLAVASGAAVAQSSNGVGQATSGSESGAQAQTGAITFEAAEQRGRIATTPPVYTPPSMFGGANNCGMSNTLGIGMTGFGFGGSSASESANCNAREDTAIAYKLGMQDVAKMRFFCFGADANRLAYEASGGVCPEGSTAKSLAQAKAEQQPRQPYLP